MLEWTLLWIASIGVAAIIVSLGVALLVSVGGYWVQAYSANADVSLSSLIAIQLLGLNCPAIVNAKIMARQAGIRIDHQPGGMTTESLQAHALAGGDVDRVVHSLVIAQQAGLPFDFDSAAAIDLAGRNVLEAVQTSVLPRVIRCPPASESSNTALSGFTKDGIELLVSVSLTVRTNLGQLIGGATEETLIARIGERIVANIGATDNYSDILAMPSLISPMHSAQELSANTVFDIVSIDIGTVVVGANVGARLAIDQAQADMLVSVASAEDRRCQAAAEEQVMKAKVLEMQAYLVLQEASVPLALADALRRGAIGMESYRCMCENSGMAIVHASPNASDASRDSEVRKRLTFSASSVTVANRC